MLNKFISSKIWPTLILIIFVALFWHPILFNNEFFYDDMAFIRTFEAGQFSPKYMFTPHNDHLMPHFKLIFFMLYKLFGVNIVPCMVLSIFVHVINSILFFILCRFIFYKNRWLPFFTAIFFAVNSSYFEVLHWFVVLNTALSLLFFLLSLVFLHRYSLEKKKWMFVISLISSFFIPMGFSLGLLGIVFIFLYAWFALKIRDIKIFASYLIVWLLFIVFYVIFVVAAGHSRTEVLSFNILEIVQYVFVGFFGAWFKTMGFSITVAPSTLLLSAVFALQMIFVGYFLILYFFLNKKDERIEALGNRGLLWFCLFGAALSYAAVAIGRSHLSKDVFLYWGRYQFFPIFFLSILLGNAALPIFNIFKKVFNARRLFIFFTILFSLYLILQFAVIRQKAFSSYRIEGALPKIEIAV